MADSRRRLVLTGGRGELATSIQRYAKNWRVITVERGDDLDEAVSEADAILVLDAARPLAVASDYRIALRAVGAVLERGEVDCVVSITMLPADESARRAFLEAANEADAELRAVQPKFTPIRCSLVVGTLQEDGPSDSVIRASGPTKLVPGNGSQKVRPIRVDDLTRIAVEALSLPAPDSEEVIAEGPHEFTLDALVRQVNGAQIRLLHYPPGVLDLVFLFFPWIAYNTRAQLPKTDFLIGNAPCRKVQEVTLRPVADEWNDTTRQERALRADRRHARSVYRATRSSNLVATFLASIGLTAIIVGLHDAFVTSRLSPQVESLMLVFTGVFITGSGCALMRSWKYRYEAALLGAALAAVMLSVIWAAALVNGDGSSVWRFPIGPYLIAAAWGTCFALRRRGRLILAPFLRKGGLRQVSGILVGSTAIALAQFLYGSIYVPAAATPTLNVTATTEPGKPAGKRRPLTVTITIRNPSDQPVNVLAASYEVQEAKVSGRGTKRTEHPLTQAVLKRWRKRLVNSGRIRMDASASPAHVVEIGALVTPGTFVEPSEQIDRRMVIYAPANYRAPKLSVDIALARRRFENQLAFSLDVTTVNRRPVLDAVDEIADRSWLHKLTRGAREIHAVRSLDGRDLSLCSGGRLAVFIDNEKSTDLLNGECSGAAGRMARHYGITYAHTETETVLPSARK